MARLEQRRRLYYAVRDIPKPLQAKLGKRRFLKSTGTGDRAEAQLVAATFDVAWLEKIARAKDGPTRKLTPEEIETRIHRRAAYWRERIANAAPSSRELVIDQMKDEAREELDFDDPSDPEGIRRAELFVEIALGEQVLLEEHIEEFLAEKADTTPKTIDLYRTSLHRFCKRFPNSLDVDKRALTSWVGQMRDNGMADNTIQRTFSAIRGYWSFLQDTGRLDHRSEPFSDILKTRDRSKNRRGKTQSYRPFEPSDVIRLLQTAEEKTDADLADLIQLGMWTGCRIESLCSLRLTDVSPVSIRVNDKTDAGDRAVPIHSKLKPTLDRLCASSCDGFVLSGLSQNKYGDRSNAIGKRFGRLKKELGFTGRVWAFHSIRKTVVTQLQRAGVPEEVTMSIVGHENNSITYGLYSAGPSMEQKRDAIEKLSYPDL